MKNLLTLSLLTAVLSSCSGGSSSGAGNSTIQPISNPAGSVFLQMSLNKFYVPLATTCLSDGSFYYQESFTRATNDEFIHFRTYFSDVSCLDTQLYASKVYTFTSYVLVNTEQKTSFTLIDVQLALVDNNLISAYNAGSMYEFNDWDTNAKSIINRKAQPSAANPQFISGTISDYMMRFVSDNNLFVNGIQYQ